MFDDDEEDLYKRLEEACGGSKQNSTDKIETYCSKLYYIFFGKK